MKPLTPMAVKPTLQAALFWARRATVAGLSVMALSLIAHLAGMKLASLPLTVTVVVVAMMPESPIASVRAIIGGHLLCAAMGIAAASAPMVPNAAVFAVAASCFLMAWLRCLHPPAALSPLQIADHPPDWPHAIPAFAAGLCLAVALSYVTSHRHMLMRLKPRDRSEHP